MASTHDGSSGGGSTRDRPTAEGAGRRAAIRDVRMRGFAARADVEEVERFLAERAAPLSAEEVPLAACAGRVLAAEVRAKVDVPAFARSAMDGYAVRGEDTFGASDYDPVALELVGESMPGRPFSGRVGPGQAVRIMTGAPLPADADAVAPAEIAREVADGKTVAAGARVEARPRGRAGLRDEVAGDGRTGAQVEIREAVAPRRHVGSVGEDIARDTSVLRAGRRLRPQDVGVLASIGADRVRCVARPRVRLVVTGDELLPAGSRPRDARIVDSNSPMLAALVERDGGVLLPHEILPDRPERVRAELLRGDADVVLVSGGSSVGREDHAPRLVAELGSLDFHGVSMRPSSPAGVGRLSRRPDPAGSSSDPATAGGPAAFSGEGAPGERWVFLLPGNPVSCLCAYEFFAGPTLRALGGRPRPWVWPHRRVRRPLARKIASAVGRTDYVRVSLEKGRVVPISTSGASILSSTVRADGVVVVPREREGMPEGAEVEVLLYDDVEGDAVGSDPPAPETGP